MRNFVTRASRSPIGCAFTSDGVALAQIVTPSSGEPAATFEWEPWTAVGTEIETDASTARILQRMLQRGRFQRSHAVACMPSERIRYRRVSASPRPGDNAARTLCEQVARNEGVPPSSIRVEAYELPSRGGLQPHTADQIAIIASSTSVDGCARVLEQAGLAVSAIDTSSSAIARCLSSGGGSVRTMDPTLVVELRPGSGTFSIAQGPATVFACLARGAVGAEALGRGTDGEQGPYLVGSKGTGRGVSSLASSLSTEVRLLLQFLSDEGLSNLIPSRGVLVGIDHIESAVLAVLAEHSPVAFVPLHSALSTFAQARVSPRPIGMTIGHATLALGLALYGDESLAERAA